MNDLITVVIPVYNAEKTLKKCIMSVVNQTYTNLDIILVNDCSKDKSSQICDKWAKKDNRIRTIHKERNQGLSAARNSGIIIAKGKYIKFLDSDDWLPKKSIEILYTNIVSFSADFCQGNERKILTCHRQKYTGKVKNYLCDNDNDRVCFLKNIYGVWLTLYSMDLIRAHSIKFCEDVKMYEDSIFNNTYAKHVKRAIIVDNCVYNYNRLILGSMSRNNKIDYEKHLKHTINTYFEIYERNEEASKIQGYNKYIHTVILDLGRRIVEGQDKTAALEYIQILKDEFSKILIEHNLQLFNVSSFLKLFIEGSLDEIFNYLNLAFNNKKTKLKYKIKKQIAPFLHFCVFKLNLIK